MFLSWLLVMLIVFSPGDCPWKDPEVQGRKIRTWTVSRSLEKENSNSFEVLLLLLFFLVNNGCRVRFLSRYKVSGPDGSNYWVSHGAHIGGSDADDAWLSFTLHFQVYILQPQCFLFNSCEFRTCNSSYWQFAQLAVGNINENIWLLIPI